MRDLAVVLVTVTPNSKQYRVPLKTLLFFNALDRLLADRAHDVTHDPVNVVRRADDGHSSKVAMMKLLAVTAVESLYVVPIIGATTATETVKEELPPIIHINFEAKRDSVSRHPDPIIGDDLRDTTDTYRPPPT